MATRHDEIQKLKNENMSLEEKLKSHDKNMWFKDEIIKELRKDCKKVNEPTHICLFFVSTSQFHFFTVFHIQLMRKTDYLTSQPGSTNSDINSIKSKSKSKSKHKSDSYSSFTMSSSN